MEYGWLRREPTSPGEIRALLAIVDRNLSDSRVQAISADLRFIAAFSAALTAATAALRACGFRVPTQTGHHLRTIESLEYTVGCNHELIQKLKTFNNKRNKTSYDVSGGVSHQELAAMIQLSTELKGQILRWLQQTNPELLKP